MNQPTQQEQHKLLIDKIKDVKVAMMTTTEPDGSLHSRPMHTSQVKEDGVLWFFTGYSSGKTAELQEDSHVNIAYADPSQDLYVSVSGRATVTRDRTKIDELWNPVLKAWFPEGKEDPNVALIKVTPNKAEYWDSPSSKLVQLVGFVKAVATGEPYRPDSPGEHGKVNL